MFGAYRERGYVRDYTELYIRDAFWQAKYRCNESVIRGLLEVQRPRSWVDLCCGQGQYFALLDGRDDVRCIGVDASAEQVALARANGTAKAEFVVANVLDRDLPSRIGAADLVTLMWGAYCYLRGAEDVAALFRNIARILRPRGSLFLEIVEPASLESFNTTGFARRWGARVVDIAQRQDGSVRWAYEDSGGIHQLFSPTLEWVLESLASAGISGRRVSTVQTLHQVVGYRL